MRTRLLFTLSGLALLVRSVSSCGGPALDDFEHAPMSPDAGGQGPIEIGNRPRGGSAGRDASDRGGTSSKNEGGSKLAASGGSAASPAEPGIDEAPSSAGSASHEGPLPEPAGTRPVPNGGRANSNGGAASANGAVSSNGGASAPSGAAGDASTGGSEPDHAGGGTSEPHGGAPAAGGAEGGVTDPPAGAAGVSSSGGSAGAPVSHEPPERTLWFSEYVEGGGNRKALELAALDEQTTSGCRIEVFSNGESDSPSSYLLDAPVAPAAPLVVCTKELNAILEGLCLEMNLNFNGDDAVVLRCDDQVIDAIGQVGSDPGTRWGDGDLRTVDMTLRRSCDVTSGDRIESDAFDPGAEWQAIATDAFEGLGTHCPPMP